MEYLRQVWHNLSQYCPCFCAEQSQGNEPSERTHLLADPSNSSPALRTNSENFCQEYSQSYPQKDDQNALSRLVQNTAVNMIDVGAMDSHNLEHQEIRDRIRMYSNCLQQQWSSIQDPKKASTGLLKDMPDPEGLLVKSVSVEDLIQIKSALNKAHAALNEIKVEHKEAIVVPFQIL